MGSWRASVGLSLSLAGLACAEVEDVEDCPAMLAMLAAPSSDVQGWFNTMLDRETALLQLSYGRALAGEPVYVGAIEYGYGTQTELATRAGTLFVQLPDRDGRPSVALPLLLPNDEGRGLVVGYVEAEPGTPLRGRIEYASTGAELRWIDLPCTGALLELTAAPVTIELDLQCPNTGTGLESWTLRGAVDRVPTEALTADVLLAQAGSNAASANLVERGNGRLDLRRTTGYRFPIGDACADEVWWTRTWSLNSICPEPAVVSELSIDSVERCCCAMFDCQAHEESCRLLD